MILTKFKMWLISFLLLGGINFATSTKPKIFTIMSTTTLQRNQENIRTFESESTGNEAALKNIFMSLLKTFNETEAFESSTHKMDPSESVELSDTYISFGNISAMLTNVTYVDFSQLASSTVDILMKVEEGPDQRNIHINNTVTAEKMTLSGNVILLGSNYGFTIELTKPTFHVNKLISEEASRTTTNQSETFTFNDITTNFQPKDFKTLLIGRSGLMTSILQRMADSWLPPIIESLNKNSLSHKIQHYEMKLRTDDRNSFSRRICRWIKMQSEFSANYVLNNADGIMSMIIPRMNIGSYESCDCGVLSVKGVNNTRILISLVLDYGPWGYAMGYLSRATTTTTPDYDVTVNYDENPVRLQNHDACRFFLNFRTIETTMEFEIEEETNKISKINNKFTNVYDKQSPVEISCPAMYMTQKIFLHSILQEKLTEYLTKLLIN